MNIQTNWYDSKEHIEKEISVSGLAGLHRVMNSRIDAAKLSDESLTEFYIAGNWQADQFGQWKKILWAEGKPDIEFPLVLTDNDWWIFCQDNNQAESIVTYITLNIFRVYFLKA